MPVPIPCIGAFCLPPFTLAAMFNLQAKRYDTWGVASLKYTPTPNCILRRPSRKDERRHNLLSASVDTYPFQLCQEVHQEGGP